jgi:hypothetical protein
MHRQPQEKDKEKNHMPKQQLQDLCYIPLGGCLPLHQGPISTERCNSQPQHQAATAAAWMTNDTFHCCIPLKRECS